MAGDPRRGSGQALGSPSIRNVSDDWGGWIGEDCQGLFCARTHKGAGPHSSCTGTRGPACSLDLWHDGADGSPHHREFLAGYGDFLAALARTTQLMSRIDEDRLTQQYIDLCALTEEAQRHRNSLARNADENSLPLADPREPYGILLAEATRLMDEFQHTCEVLHRVVDHPDRRPAAA